MANTNQPGDLTEALSAPLGDVIAAVGRGVAEAQHAMDAHTIDTIKTMAAGENEVMEQMRRIGWRPTWYKIPEVDAEIAVSLTVGGTESEVGVRGGGLGRIKLYAAPIDASYSNKYDFNLRAASHVKFRIVPVPPTPESESVRIVPTLARRTVGQARALLDELAIPYEFDGDPPADEAWVSRFEPAAGEILARGESVRLFT